MCEYQRPLVCFLETRNIMAEPSKFGATLNSGYFRFLSISHSGEVLELLFSAELKTTCLQFNMVYAKGTT